MDRCYLTLALQMSFACLFDNDDDFRLLQRKLRKTLNLSIHGLFCVKHTGLLCFSVDKNKCRFYVYS